MSCVRELFLCSYRSKLWRWGKASTPVLIGVACPNCGVGSHLGMAAIMIRCVMQATEETATEVPSLLPWPLTNAELQELSEAQQMHAGYKTNRLFGDLGER